MYAEDLLRNHRQHFNVDTVELVEARPSTLLRQTREEPTHNLVVKAVRAVEHHAVDCQSLREVFRGFLQWWMWCDVGVMVVGVV